MFVLATDGDIVPKPIDAIRHVLETIITERERANSSRETMANIRPPRDSRLKSTIGLNITEDENVLMKLHEQQKKKNPKENQIKKENLQLKQVRLFRRNQEILFECNRINDNLLVQKM